jgi:predicted AAA+ superfamily ATPase
LYGLKAIAECNGWIISVLGIIIVFSGLVFLSFLVSQIYKILNIWDNRKAYIKSFFEKFKKSKLKSEHKIIIPENLEETKRIMKLLTNIIGEPFSMPKLIKMAENRGLSKPYSAVNDLLEADIIISDDKGYFIWKT